MVILNELRQAKMILAGSVRNVIQVVFLGVFLLSGTAPAVDMELGPYVQFTGPETAVVRWDTAASRDSIVQFGTSPDALDEQLADAAATTIHEITLDNLSFKAKYFYRVGYTDGSEKFTDVYWFDNAINYSRVDVSAVSSPWPADSSSALYEAAADQILTQTGITKGLCLVYGCDQGQLAFELAKRTDMIIEVVDEDKGRIDLAAEKLMQAGVYGARVTVRHVESLNSLAYSKYLANMIVSERMISDGTCPGSASEMFRILRPSGGIAYLGQPDGCPNVLTENELRSWLNEQFASDDYTITNDSNGLWAQKVREPVPGSGWWDHQYGGAHNNGCSNDALEGANGTGDMQLQWISWPGSDAAIDRQIRQPVPVASNGRLFHQGFNRIMAMDSYNGIMLWSLEIPKMRRLNMPQDASNMCADDDYVYLAVGNNCWRLDGDTGIRTLTYKLDDTGRDWGCTFRYGDKLVGSAQVEGASYTVWWGTSAWYNNPVASQASKICSKYIFANDARTGARIWTYPADRNGVIINSAVAIGNDRVYLVESRNPIARNHTSGRFYMNELWQNQYLVALDVNSMNPNGTVLWQQPIDTIDGTAVFYLYYANERLIIQTSNGNHYLYAYDAGSGSPVWNKAIASPTTGHSPAIKRGAIVGNTIFCQPKGYSIINGTEVVSNGVAAAECGIFSASRDFLLYRPHGNITMWNINTRIATDWSKIRQGCWLNVIPAGGMVLAPEGAGGCDCYGWFHTSVGFVRSE